MCDVPADGRHVSGEELILGLHQDPGQIDVGSPLHQPGSRVIGQFERKRLITIKFAPALDPGEAVADQNRVLRFAFARACLICPTPARASHPNIASLRQSGQARSPGRQLGSSGGLAGDDETGRTQDRQQIQPAGR
jgi:hypothetical protein